MGHSPQSDPPARHFLHLPRSLPVGAGRDPSTHQRLRLLETPALAAEAGGLTDGLWGSAVQEEGRVDAVDGQSPQYVTPQHRCSEPPGETQEGSEVQWSSVNVPPLQMDKTEACWLSREKTARRITLRGMQRAGDAIKCF